MRRLGWVLCGADYVLRRKCKAIYRFPYSKNMMYAAQEANDMLRNKILSGESLFIGRLGLFELAAMRAYEFHCKDKYQVVMQQIYECAGFFPLDINLGNEFLTEMKESLKVNDLLACSTQVCENYFINKYQPKGAGCINSLQIMEPWRFENPWSEALKGKKVLVVTPFDESVTEQYAKRERLFVGTEILPEFELVTYKALQTTGDLRDERFGNWFEALEHMYSEIKELDYDIALLGCGAYGFPLAAKMKKDGKQAIHMGGVLQLLFGIMGKRWDGTGPNSSTKQIRQDIAQYYNSDWTYPKESETPQNAGKVEYGPYWR